MIRRPPRSTLFPTRRSSDLTFAPSDLRPATCDLRLMRPLGALTSLLCLAALPALLALYRTDRKSTRLNSSHSQISYAVFCLKKKTLHRPAQVQAIQATLPAR